MPKSPSKRAAAERMVSKLSEGEPPPEARVEGPVPGRALAGIAGIGNVLRHDYERLDPAVVIKWRTAGHLDQLRGAVEVLLDEIEPDWRRLRDERRRRWP